MTPSWWWPWTRRLPTWQDAAGWLKVEAAFAAAGGRLAQWVAELPERLMVAGAPTRSRHTVPMSVTEVPAVPRPAPATLQAARDALGDLLGADRVRTGADDLAQHGHDESFHPEARPDMVVWPRSIDEAAAIVGDRRGPSPAAGAVRSRHLAGGPRRRARRRPVDRHARDERDRAPVARGSRRRRAGRGHAPGAGRAPAARGRVLRRGPGGRRHHRRHDRHRRLGDDDRPLRRDARERARRSPSSTPTARSSAPILGRASPRRATTSRGS